MITLNLGCGNETFGDVRADIVKTNTNNITFDFNKPFPFLDNTFDLVYSKSVFEHIRNLDNFIFEIKRILKPNGKFFILTDNANYIGFQLQNHQDYIKYDWNKNDYHYYLFKEEHLLNWFRSFRNLRINYSYPSTKLFFLPKKFKCMHIEIRGVK